MADIGVFPDRKYNGDGIKIGVIDEGVPNINTNLDLSKTTFHGTTQSNHTFKVSSVLGGKTGVSKNSNLYFASKTDYDIFECLDWLISTANVNIINMSAGENVKGGYSGKYDATTDYFDYLIKETKVTIVCAVGNIGQVDHISMPATGLNVIAVGGCDYQQKRAFKSAFTINDEYQNYIKKPNFLAPGKNIYGVKNVSEALDGTSYSAPLTTGIIALLMQEYPYLQSHPELVMSLLDNSCNMGNGQIDSWEREFGYGIVNYQNARLSYGKMIKSNISNYVSNNALLATKIVNIPINSTFKITGNILFNSIYGTNREGHQNDELVNEAKLQCSKIRVVLSDMEDNEIISKSNYGNLADLRYTNTSTNTDFQIKIYLDGSKLTDDIEEYSFSYSNSADSFVSNVYVDSGNYLDELPTFKFNVLNKPKNTFLYKYKLVVANYRNDILMTKTDVNEESGYTLTKQEWRNIIDSVGNEYYAYSIYYNPNGEQIYYSSNTCTTIHDPCDYNHKIQIKPYEWGFAQRYYFKNEISDDKVETERERRYTQFIKNGLTINTDRLRCGYIEKSFIVLSPLRKDAGEAYLTLTFDKPIYSYMIGVTAWSVKESLYSNGLAAIIETMDENGVWSESLDLINDIILPNSRSMVDRYMSFSSEGIYGIKFYMTAPAIGDRNKGRICIDDIVLSDNPNDTDFLTTFYEATMF